MSLHDVTMILLQRANLKSAVVVLVHEAFDGGGEGGDGGGDRHAADHCLAAHLDFIDHGFGANNCFFTLATSTCKSIRLKFSFPEKEIPAIKL